jgi:hypothetical protein
MTRFVCLILLFLCLCAGAGARAQSRPDANCSDDRGADRCAAEQQRRTRASFGVPPVEALRDAGAQVRRVFYVDGYGRDLIALSLVRAPGRDPVVSVHFPRREGEGPTPPLEALLPLAVWQEAISRSARFDRALVPLPADPDAMEICLHSWVYTVEAYDPPRANERPASVRTRTEDARRPGLAADYAGALPDLLLPLFPACAHLDPSEHRNAAARFAACRILRGDRLAAAEVLNRMDAFRRASGPEAGHWLDGIFAQDAAIDWAGARSPAGGRAARDFWLTQAADGGRSNFYYDAVEGLAADRVRVTGKLVRATEAGGISSYHEAAVEQIWVFGAMREFQIARATVGPWTPVRQR